MVVSGTETAIFLRYACKELLRKGGGAMLKGKDMVILALIWSQWHLLLFLTGTIISLLLGLLLDDLNFASADC